MAFLKINGVALPPCTRDVGIVVSTVVNTGRNANGVVVGQRIGRDLYKIDELKWSWLTAAQWQQILSLLSPFFVWLTFTDPVSGQERTIQVYPGDRKAQPYWVDAQGKPTHYRDCKVNLIDTGA